MILALHFHILPDFKWMFATAHIEGKIKIKKVHLCDFTPHPTLEICLHEHT